MTTLPLILALGASAQEARIDELMEGLTLREKIGQMVLAEVGTPVGPNIQSPVSPDEIAEACIGGGLILGPMGTEKTAVAWRERLDRARQGARDSSCGIPLIIGIDAVHGHSYFDGPSVIFPHNIGLGASGDPELVREVARVTAAEVLATGVDWTFSPTMAVSRDHRWGRVYESFGETTEVQRLFTAPYVLGMQSGGVAATGKHFVGEGETVGGKDRGESLISEAELRQRHLPGYLDAIEAGVLVMMASFHTWNGQQVHGHRWLLTTLLKEELGFQGFVVSDWRGAWESGLTVTQSVAAGVDMHMLPDPFGEGPRWTDFVDELETSVESGRLPQERIDDAVRRILRVKLALGLFEERQLPADMGTPAHREVARRAVRQSLVLLKNEGTLPLSRDETVVLVGAHADHAGLQSGGWTKAWQGLDQRTYPGATTILEGMRQVSGHPERVLHAPEGELVQADVAVIVTGEPPYAELFGDRAAEELVLTAEQKAWFETYSAAGIPIVFVLISGRPLLIGEEVDQSAAVVAAWLPGSEGAGVADVLYGDHGFTGKLPVTWPARADQMDLNHGDEPYEPLFPYGFGLGY